MSKLIFVYLLEEVTAAGKPVPAGEILQLSEKSANALVNDGLATYAEPTDETRAKIDAAQSTDDEKGSNHSNTPETDKTPSEGSQAPLNVSTDLPSDEEVAEQVDAAVKEQFDNDREMTYKALYAQYTDKELRPKAKELGVEFPYDANKGDIVNAVIDQGKAADFLK